MEFKFENVMCAIPEDHSKQSTSYDIVKEIFTDDNNKILIDLGCGNGNKMDFFKNNYPSWQYIGIDIENSPEVKSRKDNDINFLVYDGVNLPFEDEYADVIYMHQVLEHVAKPYLLVPEIYRVLSKNGFLIGSVSQLEPYHSFSTFNYTFYGLSNFLNQFGLNMYIIRPGIDGITLINRTINKFIVKRGSYTEDLFWSTESPYNYIMSEHCKKFSFDVKQQNLLKLYISGQFCFAAKK